MDERPLITPVTPLPFNVERPKAEVPTPASPLENEAFYAHLKQLWEPRWYDGILIFVKDTAFKARLSTGLAWHFTKLYVGLKMNNDKKTTILGWLNGLLKFVLAMFAGEQLKEHSPESISGMVVEVVGTIWSLITIAQGIFINKKDA